MLAVAAPWLSLRTERFAEMSAFYSELFGPPQRYKSGSWSCYGVGSVTLVLWRDAQNVQPGRNLQLCLRVANLETALVQLPAGCAIGQARGVEGGRELEFVDPDGNAIFLFEPGDGSLADLP